MKNNKNLISIIIRTKDEAWIELLNSILSQSIKTLKL